MARLVVIDRKKDWQPCRICGHRVSPQIRACDEAWQHLPCTAEGCIVEQLNIVEVENDNGN